MLPSYHLISHVISHVTCQWDTHPSNVTGFHCNIWVAMITINFVFMFVWYLVKRKRTLWTHNFLHTSCTQFWRIDKCSSGLINFVIWSWQGAVEGIGTWPCPGGGLCHVTDIFFPVYLMCVYVRYKITLPSFIFLHSLAFLFALRICCDSQNNYCDSMQQILFDVVQTPWYHYITCHWCSF